MAADPIVPVRSDIIHKHGEEGNFDRITNSAERMALAELGGDITDDDDAPPAPRAALRSRAAPDAEVEELPQRQPPPPPKGKVKLQVTISGLGTIAMDIVEVLEDKDGKCYAFIYDTTSGNKFEPVAEQHYELAWGEQTIRGLFTGMKLSYKEKPWVMLVFLVPDEDSA